MGHVTAPLFWGDGKGSKGEKGVAGCSQGHLPPLPRNVGLPCIGSNPYLGTPRPSTYTRRQNLSGAFCRGYWTLKIQTLPTPCRLQVRSDLKSSQTE